MTRNDKVENIFGILYETRYKGSNIGSLLSDLDEIITINRNSQNNLSHEIIAKELLKISKYDIEFYTRSMNYSIHKSLTCLEYFFMKCSFLILYNRYDGRLVSLDEESNPFCRNIYETIYENTIEIILDGGYREEIDISEASGKIYIGRDPRSYVSDVVLGNYMANILDLLNKKYSKELTETYSCLDENELLSLVKKLNRVYQKMNEFKLKPILKLPYSSKISEDLFPKEEELKEDEYDELLFNEYKILFFPLINDVRIADYKISVFNEGYGCLRNCTLFILYQDIIIASKKIEISHDKSYDFYLNEEIRSIIQKEDPNNTVDFKFIFHKFGKKYELIFSKQIGKIRETLKESIGDNVSIHIEHIAGDSIFVNGTNNGNIIQIKDKEKLSNYYNELLENIDNFKIKEDEKESVRNKIHNALEEVEKFNSDVSIAKKLTQQAFQIIGYVDNSSLHGIILKIKEILNI
jgi:hypothetical protein